MNERPMRRTRAAARMDLTLIWLLHLRLNRSPEIVTELEWSAAREPRVPRDDRTEPRSARRAML
jgi:hypothetical protein